MNILKSILTSLLVTVSTSAWSAEQIEICRGICGETAFVNAYQVISSDRSDGLPTCQRISSVPKTFKLAAAQDLQCVKYATSMLQSACGMYGNSIENVSCKAYVKP